MQGYGVLLHHSQVRRHKAHVTLKLKCGMQGLLPGHDLEPLCGWPAEQSGRLRRPLPLQELWMVNLQTKWGIHKRVFVIPIRGKAIGTAVPLIHNQKMLSRGVIRRQQSGIGRRSTNWVKTGATADVPVVDVTVADTCAAFRAGGAWSGVESSESVERNS